MNQNKKSSIRTEYSRYRKDILKQRPDLQEKLQKRLGRFLMKNATNGIWAAYCALPDEVDPQPAIEKADRVLWAFPKISEKCLEFFIPKKEGFVPGQFGILEPGEGARPVLPEEISAYLVPGCVFDPSGNRIGRGKAYYDNYFNQSTSRALKVGVGLFCQIYEGNIPIEEHDVKMDWVITEEQDYQC